ncbi:unnamed protein product [Malus baccata var. baccata]
MDMFTSVINPDSSNDGSKKSQQQNIHGAIWKEITHQVDQYVARWVYEAGIPFHIIDNDSFKRVMELLQIVDEDKKLSMGFLYGELQKAKMEIKETFKNNEANYQPILQIIDEKTREQLDNQLHLAGYVLNPYYLFKDQSIQHDPIIMERIFTCVKKFFPDNYDVQNQVINVEMHKIMNKKKREKEKKVDILLASEASMAQGWIVEGGDEELELGSGIGETLEDEDTEEKEGDDEEVEFELDTERVLEGYDERRMKIVEMGCALVLNSSMHYYAKIGDVITATCWSKMKYKKTWNNGQR